MLFSIVSLLQVTNAEVLWLLKLVEDDIPFATCDDIKQLLTLMFPNENLIKDMSCGATKASYVISHGIAPYFRDLLTSDVIKSNTGYTIHFDETTSAQLKKQMDLVIRYYSTLRKKVVVHYLDSAFFGHATADTVTSTLINTLASHRLPVSKLLNLSSDGPNVNKSIIAQVNKQLTDAKLPVLVNIGSCNLHKVHNAFARGIAVFGRNAEELSVKLFYWFRNSAARREDLTDIQFDLNVDEVFFLRHTPSRWLTLQPAILRILNQWAAIKAYFSSRHQEDETNEHYRATRRLLDSPLTHVQLQFIADVAPMFSQFLQLFQREDPLIHIICAEMNSLVRKLMLRFVKTDVVGSKSGDELAKVDVKELKNLRSLDDIEIGEATRQSMKKVKPEQHKAVLLDIRQFFTITTQYLMKNLPLSNTVLQDVQCLDPAARKLVGQSFGAINYK